MTNEANITEPARRRCRHIFGDGRRYGSPSLRNEDFCYYHHTTRRSATNPQTRKARRASLDLRIPEDRAAIQLSTGLILERLASNDLDPRRAGLLLYGLQIASSNLPPAAPRPRTPSPRAAHRRWSSPTPITPSRPACRRPQKSRRDVGRYPSRTQNARRARAAASPA